MTYGDNFSAEESRRLVIVELLRIGRTPSEIHRYTQYPRSTVYRIANAFEAKEAVLPGSASSSRKTYNRTRSQRDAETIEAVREALYADPSLSIRTLAANFNMSARTMGRLVREDLRHKSYALEIRKTLSASEKATRMLRCQKLLRSLRHEAIGRILFFSDAKIFTPDTKIHQQNSRWRVLYPKDFAQKDAAGVHVLGVVSSEGVVMPPHFFEKSETIIDEEAYLRVLRDIVKPWMDTVAAGRPYVFQQSGAPIHNSDLVQQWLAANVSMFWPKDIWPFNSPDLNPIDYFVWGYVERRLNKHKNSDVDSLKQAITESFAEIPNRMLRKACERFRLRLESVIAADGSYIQ